MCYFVPVPSCPGVPFVLWEDEVQAHGRAVSGSRRLPACFRLTRPCGLCGAAASADRGGRVRGSESGVLGERGLPPGPALVSAELGGWFVSKAVGASSYDSRSGGGLLCVPCPPPPPFVKGHFPIESLRAGMPVMHTPRTPEHQQPPWRWCICTFGRPAAV